MFAFFESRVHPTQPPAGAPPPGLLAFYWHFVRQTRWLFAAMFVTGLAVALVDTLIPVFIGKLVSLMSLQMLPRRAAGDFRDVFSKGFQFDRITSSMDIARGVMAVKDFHMNGPAADVNMTGQIDLALETQTLQVRSRRNWATPPRRWWAW